MTEMSSLAAQYEQCAETVLCRIHERNTRLKSLNPACSEAMKIKREISILYDERLEALKSAVKLKNYYMKEN